MEMYDMGGGGFSASGGKESPASKIAIAMIVIGIILLIIGMALGWTELSDVNRWLIVIGIGGYLGGTLLYKFTSPKKD